MPPHLIGVAGPSGSGKSELAQYLARHLPGTTAVIPLDSYYRAMAHLPFEERARLNFDHPEALDWELIRTDLRKLARGEAIDEPIYRFDQHARSAETRRVEPADFILIEGLFALYDPAVLDALKLRIFVYAPDEVCLARRIGRDTLERGRSRQSVLDQYAQTVRPMAERYVLPTRRNAHLALSGEQPLDQSWAAVEELMGGAAPRSVSRVAASASSNT
jgi:uridine kinase